MNDTNIIEWLEKLAVDTEVLQERLSRVPGVFQMSRKEARGDEGPAWAIPRVGQAKEYAAHEGAKNPSKKVSKMLAKYKQMGGGVPGRIEIADPHTHARLLGRTDLSAETERAWHAATTAHELFERGTHPKTMQPAVREVAGHNNLNVLVKERNLRNRLTGKSAEEVVSLETQMRDIPAIHQLRSAARGRSIQLSGEKMSENQLVERTVRHAFGRDEASHFLQPGQTMNRSMRKALDRILAKTDNSPLGLALLGR